MKNYLLLFLLCFALNPMFSQGPPPGCTPTTYNGTWSAFTPSTTGVEALGIVIIESDYNTSSSGSFECCSLIIRDGATLTISGTDYVSVHGTATTDGVFLEGTGALVVGPDSIGLAQTSDFSDFQGTNATLNRINTINAATEVTYWSSPVVNKTVNECFGDDSWGGYRYTFETANFEDSFYETNNNNTLVYGPGIDGIDDNGDDYQFAYQNDVLYPGVGIITRQAPGSAAGDYPYDFEGQFNNGYITLPVTRNDADVTNQDENPIFTGNPYPSTISVDSFFALNVFNEVTLPSGILDARVFIWNASIPPSSTANGNQVLNFSANDYATINLLGQVASNNGVTPGRFIEPGQGFFTAYSSSPLVAQTGSVIFSNVMRSPALYPLYAGTPLPPASSERVWLNLTTETGIHGEILLGYTEDATDGDDGNGYDSQTRNPKGQFAMLYFTSADLEDKYNIQGKALSSLDTNETVGLGFFNSVVDQTDFTLSIDELEGDFMESSELYLKDNLLDICHNLSVEDYIFTSEMGEFNDRFELLFQSCDFSPECEAIFNVIASNVEEKNCGKYKIKLPVNALNGYYVTYSVDGAPAQEFSRNNHFKFTENGTHTLDIIVVDENTGAVCYANTIELVVDCLSRSSLDNSDELDDQKITFSIAPNPAKNNIVLSFSDRSIVSFNVRIKNIFGGTLVSAIDRTNLDISSLISGVYFIEVTTQNGTIIRKQLIVR